MLMRLFLQWVRRLPVSSVMGKPTLPAYREDLTYRVIPTEQGKPVSLPSRGSDSRKVDRWRCGYEMREKANAAL